MKPIIGLAALVGIGVVCLARAEELPQLTLEEKADGLYLKGDCVNAMTMYQTLFQDPSSGDDLKDLIRFRASYCYFTLNQNQAASRSFEEFLRRRPENEEARIKYAEVLFRLGRFRDARYEAMKVKDPKYLGDARLVAAQADMKLGNDLQVLHDLNVKGLAKEWIPVFHYWKGVALYRWGELKLALEYFQKSHKNSVPDAWSYQESQTWIKKIEDELKLLRGHLNLGYFMDSNVAQQSQLPAFNGVARLPGPLSSSYITDTGYTASLNLTALLRHSRPFKFYAALDVSASNYVHQKSFSNQTIALSLLGQFLISQRVGLSVSGKYLDSRYYYRYYQDYGTLDATLNWSASDALKLGLSLNYTRQLQTRPADTIGGTLFGSYTLAEWAFASLSGTATRSNGDEARYDAFGNRGSTTVVGGSQFASYSSKGLSAGFSFLVPAEVWARLQYSRFWTDFSDERSVPRNGSDPLPSREDDLVTYRLELSRHIIRDVWYASASYTYSQNRSTGFQGIASGGFIPDYNYDRSYTLLSTSLFF